MANIIVSKNRNDDFAHVRIEVNRRVSTCDFDIYLDILKSIKNATIKNSRGENISDRKAYNDILRSIFDK